MFDFLRRHRQGEERGRAAPGAVTDVAAEPSDAETWRAKERRDRDQRPAEPGYGGGGYFGSSERGGQSFNSAQRLYPGDPGYREHPTRPVTSARIGAGPKNYARADERIRDDICNRLAIHAAIDVSEVTVEVEGGIVRLGGTVGDRYEKRQIEEIAAVVFGVNDVENRIRVVLRRDIEHQDPSERVLNRS